MSVRMVDAMGLCHAAAELEMWLVPWFLTSWSSTSSEPDQMLAHWNFPSQKILLSRRDSVHGSVFRENMLPFVFEQCDIHAVFMCVSVCVCVCVCAAAFRF